MGSQPGAAACPTPRDLRVCVCARMCGCVRAHASVTRSCPTLCDPTDCSPPGSSVHGILQARILSGLPPPSPGASQGTLVLAAVFLAVGSLPESLLQLTLTPPTMATHQGPKGRDPHAAGPPGVRHSDGRPEGPTFCLRRVLSRQPISGSGGPAPRRQGRDTEGEPHRHTFGPRLLSELRTLASRSYILVSGGRSRPAGKPSPHTGHGRHDSLFLPPRLLTVPSPATPRGGAPGGWGGGGGGGVLGPRGPGGAA